jgi:hypothetical protein
MAQLMIKTDGGALQIVAVWYYMSLRWMLAPERHPRCIRPGC